MAMIDITRELLSAPVYPGDAAPRLVSVSRMAFGDECNAAELHCHLHNGTHLDAPLHFVDCSDDAANMPLDVCVGECRVIAVNGPLSGEWAERLAPRLCERVLFKGDTEITESAAFVLSHARVRLLGVESQTVGNAAAHRQLLGAGVVLLEGLDLSKAEERYYFLFAAPLKIKGADGAPVRAVLVERQ